MPNYMSGAEMLTNAQCVTREQKLEFAVRELMCQLNELHTECKGQDLSVNLTNENIFCSCADAYRMGHEALRSE